jgi:iron complex transport system substrate-binding protein
VNRSIVAVWVCAVLVVAIAGCAPPTPVSQTSAEPSTGLPETAAEDTVIIADQAGQQVTVPQPVERIVSSYGMASLYVYAVGAGDRLAAAAFLMSPNPQIKQHLGLLTPDATQLPDPGGQQDANVEEIARLKPDLILISSRAASQDTLQALGVPVIRYEGESIERLKGAIALTGRALGPEATAQAEELVDTMNERLARIERMSANIPEDQRKRVFISGTSPLKTAGRDMLQSEMVALAGGVNVAQEISGYWTEVNLEQVTKWDPEVIFVVPYGGASVEAILDSPEWAMIGAVQNQEVFMLPKYLGPWDTPIPEALLGIEWMAARLLSDQSLREECEQRTAQFYDRFYDLAIPKEDAAALCG